MTAHDLVRLRSTGATVRIVSIGPDVWWAVVTDGTRTWALAKRDLLDDGEQAHQCACGIARVRCDYHMVLA